MGMNQTSGNKSTKNGTNTTNENIIQEEQNKKKMIEKIKKEMGNYLNTLVKDFEFTEDPMKELENSTYAYLEEELRKNERIIGYNRKKRFNIYLCNENNNIKYFAFRCNRQNENGFCSQTNIVFRHILSMYDLKNKSGEIFLNIPEHKNPCFICCNCCGFRDNYNIITEKGENIGRFEQSSSYHDGNSIYYIYDENGNQKYMTKFIITFRESDENEDDVPPVLIMKNKKVVGKIKLFNQDDCDGLIVKFPEDATVKEKFIFIFAGVIFAEKYYYGRDDGCMDYCCCCACCGIIQHCYHVCR